MSKVSITCPEEVAKLPWAGNYEDDGPLFELVNDYLIRETDRLKRWEAEKLCHKLGMGIELPDDPPPEF